ncbi:hypothetical protein HY633_00505 [Candidatus Uhrbacteria bacterium]|nr:hypothetical protein [Candidatus Uhrbacteria bacterium]
MRNSVRFISMLALSGCSVFVPGQPQDDGSTNTDNGEPEMVPVPNLTLTEAEMEDITVRPGDESLVAYVMTFSADEDVTFSGLGPFVNRADGKNMRAGDVTLAGRLTLSDDANVYVDLDAASIEPYGNAETCEVRDGVVMRGPCYFSRGSEYLRMLDPPILIAKGSTVTLKFTVSIHWRAGNSDGYRVFVKILTYERPGEDAGYQSILFGYGGPKILVQDTSSFCDLRDFGIYGSQGCCDSQGFRPAADIAGSLVTVPFMKTVFLGLGNDALARFPSSREMASWYGRLDDNGAADLDDHSVCNLVRAASFDDLLGLDATATVGLKPGEHLVAIWGQDALYVIDRFKTLRPVSLEIAAAIYGPSLGERIVFMTADDLGTPGQPGSYRLGAPIVTPGDFDPAAVSSAALLEEEIN